MGRENPFRQGNSCFLGLVGSFRPRSLTHGSRCVQIPAFQGSEGIHPAIECGCVPHDEELHAARVEMSSASIQNLLMGELPAGRQHLFVKIPGVTMEFEVGDAAQDLAGSVQPEDFGIEKTHAGLFKLFLTRS